MGTRDKVIKIRGTGFRLPLVLAASLVVVLGRVEPATASVVSVFDDPVYVDTSGGFMAESDNVQASLVFLGHTVNPFVGITSADFSAAIDASECLLIPELENQLLGPDLSALAISTLTAYVSGGGGLIINGGSNFINQSATEFLNTVFGFSLMNTNFGVGGSSTLNAIDASGTAFQGGPANVPNHSGTHPLISSLPVGTLVIYIDPGSTGASVTIIPFGSGQIIYLGWDWFDAAPVGSMDGGWLDLLDRAVEECEATCEPVEDPNVRTQGFWKRACKGPHPSGEHANLPGYVDCVNTTLTFADVDDVDALCDRLHPFPKNDKCEKAEAQFMALLLNVCSGRVATCNCIDDPDLGQTTVGDAIDFIDGLLSNPARTFQDCVLAQAIADRLNNGLTLVDCPEAFFFGPMYDNPPPFLDDSTTTPTKGSTSAR